MDPDEMNPSKPEGTCKEILLRMNKLRLSNVYCDATVVASGDHHIPVHRVVLAATSKYFKAAFDANGDFTTFQMDWVSAADMAQIVDFMYTGQVSVTAATVASLKATAEQLEVDTLLRLCDAFVAGISRGKSTRRVTDAERQARSHSGEVDVNVTRRDTADERHMASPGGDATSPSGVAATTSVSMTRACSGVTATQRVDCSPDGDGSGNEKSANGRLQASVLRKKNKMVSPQGVSPYRSQRVVAQQEAYAEEWPTTEITHARSSQSHAPNEKTSPWKAFAKDDISATGGTAAEVSDEGNSSQTAVSEGQPSQEGIELESGIEVTPTEALGKKLFPTMEASQDDEETMPLGDPTRGTMTSSKKFSCEHCSRSYTRNESLTLHYKKWHSDKTFKCRSCGGQFITAAAAGKHEEKCWMAENKVAGRYLCTWPECPYGSAKLDDTLTHYKQHKAVELGWIEEAGRAPAPEPCPLPVTCDHCGVKLASGVALRKHTFRVHPGLPVQCSVCDRSCDTEAAYHGHMFRQHGLMTTEQNAVYECRACSYTHVFQCEVDDHERSSHRARDLRPRTCDECGDELTGETDFLEHCLVTHGRDSSNDGSPPRQLYKCNEDCGFRTFKTHEFNRHEASNHGNQGEATDGNRRGKSIVMLQCPSCSYGCRKKAYLQNHMFLAHGVVCTKNKTVYKCSQCSYSHLFRYEIRRHEKTHAQAEAPLPRKISRDARGGSSARNKQPAKSNPFACRLCNVIAKNGLGLLHHTRRCHADCIEQEEGAEGGYTIVDTGLVKEDEIRRHERTPAQVEAPIVRKNPGGPRLRRTARKKLEDEESAFLQRCPSCNYVCRKKAYLQNHMFLAHGVVTTKNKIVYKCSQCSYSHLFQYEIRRHEKTHAQAEVTLARKIARDAKGGSNARNKQPTKKNPLACRFCNIIAKTKCGLRSHTRRCHADCIGSEEGAEDGHAMVDIGLVKEEKEAEYPNE